MAFQFACIPFSYPEVNSLCYLFLVILSGDFVANVMRWSPKWYSFGMFFPLNTASFLNFLQHYGCYLPLKGKCGKSDESIRCVNGISSLMNLNFWGISIILTCHSTCFIDFGNSLTWLEHDGCLLSHDQNEQDKSHLAWFCFALVKRQALLFLLLSRGLTQALLF